MSTDRELLEKAAQLSGIPICWHDEARCFMRMDCLGTVPWRPSDAILRAAAQIAKEQG